MLVMRQKRFLQNKKKVLYVNLLILGHFPKFTNGLHCLQIAFQNTFLNHLKPMVNFRTTRLFILLARLYNRDHADVVISDA